MKFYYLRGRIRHDLTSYDKSNDLKILLKSISENKYLVLAKIKIDSQESRSKFIVSSTTLIEKDSTSSTTPTTTTTTTTSTPSTPVSPPRNFLKEAQDKQKLEQDKQKLEQEKIDAIDSSRQARLPTEQAKIDAEIKRLGELRKNQQKGIQPDERGTTPEEIIRLYEEYRRSSGENPRSSQNTTDLTTTTTATVKKIMVFMPSDPIHISHKQDVSYMVLVTDDTSDKFNRIYGKFVGNVLSDVGINITIKDPTNKTLYTTLGTTGDDGTYAGSFTLPDDLTSIGFHNIFVNAMINYTDDNTFARAVAAKPFFVNPLGSSS